MVANSDAANLVTETGIHRSVYTDPEVFQAELGRYRDSLVARDGAWKLRSRLAVIEDDMIAGGKITFIV